jgi:hypothetical protein
MCEIDGCNKTFRSLATRVGHMAVAWNARQKQTNSPSFEAVMVFNSSATVMAKSFAPEAAITRAT